jgi:acetyl-CoA synthetase
MVAELPVALLACARLGAIHSVVFGGFSGQVCADGIVDSESEILITMDGHYRGGKWLNHKAKADIAFAKTRAEGRVLKKVLVFERHPGRYSSETPLVDGQDVILNDYRGHRVEPVSMHAEDPLFLMYTSGSTGKPKGVQHATGAI